MENPTACRLDWCEADHRNDSTDLVRHRRHLGEHTSNGAEIRVVIRWAEPLNGRRGIEPHISIFTQAPGEDVRTIDLTPLEARLWSGALKIGDASPWLAETLEQGANMLREWEHDDYAGLAHRVAENTPRNTPEFYLAALQAATRAARETLAGFESLPVSALNSLELMRWVGEYRGIVRSMVESVEMVAAGLAEEAGR